MSLVGYWYVYELVFVHWQNMFNFTISIIKQSRNLLNKTETIAYLFFFFHLLCVCVCVDSCPNYCLILRQRDRDIENFQQISCSAILLPDHCGCKITEPPLLWWLVAQLNWSLYTLIFGFLCLSTQITERHGKAMLWWWSCILCLFNVFTSRERKSSNVCFLQNHLKFQLSSLQCMQEQVTL